MKFKNILGILAISAVAMTTVSCSEDTMDRINKDNGHPSAEFVDAKFQLTDAIVSSVFTTMVVALHGMYLRIQNSYSDVVIIN